MFTRLGSTADSHTAARGGKIGPGTVLVVVVLVVEVEVDVVEVDVVVVIVAGNVVIAAVGGAGIDVVAGSACPSGAHPAMPTISATTEAEPADTTRRRVPTPARGRDAHVGETGGGPDHLDLRLLAAERYFDIYQESPAVRRICRVSWSGRPITLLGLPTMPATSAAPADCMP